MEKRSNSTGKRITHSCNRNLSLTENTLVRTYVRDTDNLHFTASMPRRFSVGSREAIRT